MSAPPPGPLALTDLPVDRFEALAERRFAGRNLLRWLFERRATSFDEMSDLSKEFRARLAERFHVRRSRVVEDRSDPGGTRALVLELADGKTIETVLIPEE